MTKEKAADIVGKEVAEKLFAPGATRTNLTERVWLLRSKDKFGVVLSGLTSRSAAKGCALTTTRYCPTKPTSS
jgi:hypothetical protein